MDLDGECETILDTKLYLDVVLVSRSESVDAKVRKGLQGARIAGFGCTQNHQDPKMDMRLAAKPDEMVRGSSADEELLARRGCG